LTDRLGIAATLKSHMDS